MTDSSEAGFSPKHGWTLAIQLAQPATDRFRLIEVPCGLEFDQTGNTIGIEVLGLRHMLRRLGVPVIAEIATFRTPSFRVSTSEEDDVLYIRTSQSKSSNEEAAMCQLIFDEDDRLVEIRCPCRLDDIPPEDKGEVSP